MQLDVIRTVAGSTVLDLDDEFLASAQEKGVDIYDAWALWNLYLALGYSPHRLPDDFDSMDAPEVEEVLAYGTWDSDE